MEQKTYNTNLAGLLDSATQHNAQVFTASATLSELHQKLSDYGHLPAFIDNVIKDFGNEHIRTQTKSIQVSQVMNKLINIWTLQQDILKGNNFDDFIIIHYNVLQNKKTILDIHPGRTRLYFHNSYHKEVPVLILDYTNKLQNNPPFKNMQVLSKDTCSSFKNTEYRLTDNWYLPNDDEPKYLLTQPNHNEQWHYMELQQDVKFELHHKDNVLTEITANDKTFLEYKNWIWKINTCIN